MLSNSPITQSCSSEVSWQWVLPSQTNILLIHRFSDLHLNSFSKSQVMLPTIIHTRTPLLLSVSESLVTVTTNNHLHTATIEMLAKEHIKYSKESWTNVEPMSICNKLYFICIHSNGSHIKNKQVIYYAFLGINVEKQ